MRPAGIRVINVFPGPIDDKLTPDAWAESIVGALEDGVEDIYPGEVAQEWFARWLENPKMLERDLGRSRPPRPRDRPESLLDFLL